MKDDLKRLIDAALPDILHSLQVQSFKPEDVQYDLETPKSKAHGDLAINLALKLGRTLKKNPFEIAERCHRVLEEKVRNDRSWRMQIKGITVAKPGFINFSFTEVFLANTLLSILKLSDQFGKSDFGCGKKVLIEFVSANPTGPLTIAHGRQAAIGDTLARILDTVGYRVHKEFYLNDGGRQIRLLGESLWVRYQELFGRKVDLPEDGYQGSYLVDIARSLKQEQGDSLLKLETSKVLELTTAYAVEKMMVTIKKDLQDMDVAFDEYFSEGILYERKLIEQALEHLRSKNFLYETDGALWFRSTQFGDDKDRVLRKQSGEYTYLAPDIAYHASKFKRGFEKLINLLGPDHHGYVTRLKAACQALGHSAEAIHILIVQLTTLYRQGEPVRMSTRLGEFVTLRELMDEVGVDATRFFFLMRKIESHLDFDLELAKKKSDDNPVYYLQYAHARISSILAFAGIDVERTGTFADVDLSLVREEEALDLIKKMLEYPQALKEAAQILEPYRLVDYLRELAALFHKFYVFHRVVTEDAALTKARLLLIRCAQIVLRNGLHVLGVSAPSKM